MLIHPLPNPIAFTIGPFRVYWYGLMYLLAFTQFIILGRLRIQQSHIQVIGWTKHDLDNILSYGVIAVIVGGRLGEVLFYHPTYYVLHPREIIAIWRGGMSFHGGFLGVLIAMYIWSSKSKYKFLDTMDFIAPMIPLGYAAGRLGNFINAELPGRYITNINLPWAMIWPNIDAMPRHPSPIYQMLTGILLFIILWVFASTKRPKMAVAGMFSTLYGFMRFFTEYFRTPDYNITFNNITISAGQMLSIPMIILGLILIIKAYNLIGVQR